MTKREQFQAGARRAGRAIGWPLRSGFAIFAGLALLLAGASFIQSFLPWVGVPCLLAGVGAGWYGLRWALVARRLNTTCPVCGARGEFTRGKWDYLFHCQSCDRRATTGVGVPHLGDGPP